MDYSWDFSVVFNNIDVLLRGCFWTFLLAFASVGIGLTFGGLLTFFRTSNFKIFRVLAIGYIEIFRNLPVLVTMIWMYYCLPLLFSFEVFNSPFLLAALALALNFSALQAEIFRAGMEAIPQGQIEGARGLRMSRFQTMRYVIVPQTLWRSLAPTLGQVVNTLKLTALASFIVVHELFYETSALIQATYRPLELYTTLAILYLVIITPFSFVLQITESSLAKRFK